MRPQATAGGRLTRRRFLGLGSALGLPERATTSALQEALDATESVPDELDSGALPWNANLRRTVVRQLRRRRRDLMPTA